MRRIALLLAALLAPAAPAVAAPTPDRVAVMSATSTQFAWDGQQATAAAPQQSTNGFDPNLCTKEPDYYCDVTHVKLEAAEGTTATLVFDIFDFSVPFADFDISIFHSDAAGTPGEFIKNGGNLSAAGLEETVEITEAEPGYYLVTVSYYFSPDAYYKGTIKASGITPPPPAAAAPAPAPAPASPGPATAPPKVHVRSVERRGKVVTVRLARPASARMPVVLRDARSRVVARGRVAKGASVARLRAKRAVRPGRYRLSVGASSGAVRIR